MSRTCGNKRRDHLTLDLAAPSSVPESGTHQRLTQRHARVAAQRDGRPAPVQPGPWPRHGRECLAEAGHLDHPGDHGAVHLGRDGHRPVGQAVQVVDGAVQRVNHPAHRAGSARCCGAVAGEPPRLAAFLAEDRVARADRADPPGDQGFGPAVHLRHHVGRARLGVDDLGPLRRPARRPAACPPRSAASIAIRSSASASPSSPVPVMLDAAARCNRQQSAGQVWLGTPMLPSAGRHPAIPGPRTTSWTQGQALPHQLGDHRGEPRVGAGRGRPGERESERHRRSAPPRRPGRA